MHNANIKQISASSERPLVVDLDGTLIKTDILFETASEFVTTHPFQSFKLLGWLQESKSLLKEKLAQLSRLEVAELPYNRVLVAWLHQQRELGRRIILATATHRIIADRVAAHLKIFDEVISTDRTTNLKAGFKRDALVERFGERGFDYVGNDCPDLPVWKSANRAYLVSSSPSFIAQVKKIGNLEEVFESERPAVKKAVFKALRPHQWVKNLLLFIPLLAAHRVGDFSSVINVLIAFLVFGLTASSVYLLNDISDVLDDRHHHRKRNRPFAAGNLSLLLGWCLWPIILASAFGLAALLLPPAFVGVLAAYFALTMAYSLRLKQSAILDVLTLAGLYTIRIVAGAAAISVQLSFWLISFSVFIFLSLAFIKRFSELKTARSIGHEGNIRGRGYVHQDLELVSSMGSSAGYLSVLVLALYIQDVHTAEMYSAPQLIWLACPILLYWISRAWLIAHRGQMHDDPIVFAIKDRVSWVVATCFLGVFVLARVLS